MPYVRKIYPIIANPLAYYSPKLLGHVHLRWGAFLAALTEGRYRGPVCIGVEDKAYENSPGEVKMAILTARSYLRHYVPD